MLEAGADKISVNSAALARPALIGELARTLGSQAVVVAIDTEAGRVHSHSATRDAERDTVEWARECEELGAGELLVTSIDRDGTQNGYDLELLGALRDAVSLPVIASGGAGDAQHIAAALEVVAGGAARVDPPRAARASRLAPRRASFPRRPTPRCSLS